MWPCRPALAIALVMGALALPPALAATIDIDSTLHTDDTRLKTALEAFSAGDIARADRILAPLLRDEAPSAGAHELAGMILARKGNAPGSIAAFEAALAADPRQYTALTKIGDVLLATGDHAGARDYYERAIAIAPEDRLSHQRLGLLAEEAGDIPAAIAHYEAGIRGTPADYLGVKLNLALLYNLNAEPERAIALLAPFAAQDPVPASVLRALGDARLATGDASGAVDAYRAGVMGAPDDRAMTLGLGRALLTTGDAAGAEEVLAPLVDAERADPAALLIHARALAAMGQQDEARESLEKAVTAGHATPALWRELAAMQQGAGEVQAARETLEALARAHADDPQSWLALGNLLGLERDYAAAMEAFDTGLALAPDHPGLLRGAWRAHQQTGDAGAARTLARRLADGGAATAMDLYYLGAMEEAADQDAAAIDAYRRAVALDGDLWPALNNLAVLLMAGDEAAEALSLAQRAFDLRPDQAAVAHTLGLALLRNDDAQEAEAVLQRFPEDPSCLGALAEAVANQGRADEAGEILARARAAGLDEARASAIEAAISR